MLHLFPCYTWFWIISSSSGNTSQLQYNTIASSGNCFISPSEELPIFSTSFHLLRQVLTSSLSPGPAKSCSLDQSEQGIPLVTVINLGIRSQTNSSHCKALPRLTTYCCERSFIFCQATILEDIDLAILEAIFPVHKIWERGLHLGEQTHKMRELGFQWAPIKPHWRPAPRYFSLHEPILFVRLFKSVWVGFSLAWQKSRKS